MEIDDRNDVLKYRYDVTVYVGPGDYYFFNCFTKFTEDYACELQLWDTVNGEYAQDWCTYLDDLPQANQLYDNVDFIFKPLCLYKEEFMALDLENAGTTMLDSEKETRWGEICDGVDDLFPVFNVKDPYFKFNITGSAVFEGI